MKRRALTAHLQSHGCRLDREGARHSWYFNPRTRLHSGVPRHREIVDMLDLSRARHPAAVSDAARGL